MGRARAEGLARYDGDGHQRAQRRHNHSAGVVVSVAFQVHVLPRLRDLHADDRVVSTLISLTLLPALLMLFGPAGSAGNIVWIQRATDWVSSRIGQCFRKRAAVSDSEEKV